MLHAEINYCDIFFRDKTRLFGSSSMLNNCMKNKFSRSIIIKPFNQKVDKMSNLSIKCNIR